MHTILIFILQFAFFILPIFSSPTPNPFPYPIPEPLPNPEPFSLTGALADGASSLDALSGLLNNTSGLMTFLGDHDTVIFQNAVLKNTSACPAMTVLFARGTLEPGNVGILTGPPFFAAMANYLNKTGQLAIQGVPYPADIKGFLAGGSMIGTNHMATLINTTLGKCPDTALTLSGYSQGAQIVHNAVSSLPTTVTSKISSVVLFGDPKNGTAVVNIDASKVLVICHTGDNICQGGDSIKLEHLNYSQDANMAAMFVMSGVAKLGITSAQKVNAKNGIVSN